MIAINVEDRKNNQNNILYKFILSFICIMSEEQGQVEAKNEIFEKIDEKPKVKVEIPESAPLESIDEEPDKTENKTETAKVEKPKRKKRVLTEEQKEKLRENLKKGRETSLARRRKKAQLKKIDKEEKSKADDEKIFKALKKKLQPAELEDENKSLKKQLEELKLQLSKPKKESRAKLGPKTATIDDSEDEQVHALPDTAPPKKVHAPPAPPKKKEMTARQKIKMMRGL
jgi:hypothetical protein